MRKRLSMSRFFAAVSLCALLVASGCASSGVFEGHRSIQDTKTAKMLLEPKKPKRVINVDVLFTLPNPVTLSSDTANIQIKDLKFKGTLGDLAVIFNKRKIQCFMNDRVASISVEIPYFNGTFGTLARVLSRNYGLIFREHDGFVDIKTSDVFSVSLVSLPDVLKKEIMSQMKATGLFSNLSYSAYTQQITWTGNALSVYQLKKILANVLNNYARIDMDVVIFETNYEFTRSFSLGMKGTFTPFGGVYHGKTDLNFSFGLQEGGMATNTNALNGIMTVGDFNAILQAIYSNGAGAVIQKLFLSTVNLSKGMIKEGKKIPYIKSVTQTYVNTGSNNAVPQTSVSFDEALSGITLNIQPIYLSKLNSVFTKLTINVQDVEKMVNVKAGTNEYTRPVTTTKDIESSLLMRLGKVYIFGGFEISKNNKLYSYLPISFSKNKTGVYLFFAVRPTVVVYKYSGCEAENNGGSNAVILNPPPQVDSDRQARRFVGLVKGGDYSDAAMLYRNVLPRIDVSQVKDKYAFYLALGKFLYLENRYPAAYKAFLKAYMNAKGKEKEEEALYECVRAAEGTGDYDLMYAAYLNLGDFELHYNEKFKALTNYYKALKLRKTKAVIMRIARVLEGLNEKEMRKAMEIKAYVYGSTD